MTLELSGRTRQISRWDRAGPSSGLWERSSSTGLPALTATAAVLLYRVIELWIPGVLGIAAFVQLRLLLARETDAIRLCQPGDTIEVVGLGPAIIDGSGVRSTA